LVLDESPVRGFFDGGLMPNAIFLEMLRKKLQILTSSQVTSNGSALGAAMFD